MEERVEQDTTDESSHLKEDTTQTENDSSNQPQESLAIANQIISALTEDQIPNDAADENNSDKGGTTEISKEQNENEQDDNTNKVDDENDKTDSNLENPIENNSNVENTIENNSNTENENNDDDDDDDNSKGTIEEMTDEISNILITHFDEPHVGVENSNDNQETESTEEQKNESEGDNIENEIDNIIKTQKVPNDQSRYEILSFVKKAQVDKMVESDYAAASRYHNCEVIIQNQIYQDERSYNDNNRKRQLDNRLENLRRNRERVEKEWNDRYDQYRQKTDERQKKLDETHREELQQFEEKWNSPEFFKQYNKASPSLLQLRKIEKNLALSKDYDAANQTKQIADVLQKKEEEETEKTLIITMRQQYNVMMSKQRNERECAQENWERHKLFLQLEKEKELKQIDRAAQQLELRKSQPACFANSYKTSIIAPSIKTRPTTAKTMRVSSNQVISRSVPPDNTNMNYENGIEEDSLSTTSRSSAAAMSNTPRTRKSIADYKSKPSDTKLNLTGISISQINKRNTGKCPLHPRMTRRYRNLS